MLYDLDTVGMYQYECGIPRQDSDMTLCKLKTLIVTWIDHHTHGLYGTQLISYALAWIAVLNHRLTYGVDEWLHPIFYVNIFILPCPNRDFMLVKEAPGVCSSDNFAAMPLNRSFDCAAHNNRYNALTPSIKIKHVLQIWLYDTHTQ